MGINRPTGDDRRLEELDKLIEGRWTLINRLFEDVEELVDERDRLAGRNTGFIDRLFGRRHQAPVPTSTTMVRRGLADKSNGVRRNGSMRATS